MNMVGIDICHRIFCSQITSLKFPIIQLYRNHAKQNYQIILLHICFDLRSYRPRYQIRIASLEMYT
jgi:hypothetical protein